MRTLRFALIIGVLFAPALASAQEVSEEATSPDAAEVDADVAAPESEVEPAIDGEPEPEPEPDPEPVSEPAVEQEPEVEPAPVDVPGRLPDGSLDPCATDLRSRPIGPLSVGELDGQLGVPYRVCPRNEIAVGGDVLLVADTSRFYGDIRVNGRLRMSMLLDPNVEGFVSWEAVRYQTLISSVEAAYLGLGYLSYGVTARVLSEQGRAYAITGRMVLPTTTGLNQSSQPLALDVGVTGAWQADANLRCHMWLVLLGSLGIGAGPADPRVGVRLGGGLDYRPWEWLSLVLELAAGFAYHDGTASYDDALDLVAAQAGVRLALGTEVGLELAASLPFLGGRALDTGALPLAGNLMVSWHLR